MDAVLAGLALGVAVAAGFGPVSVLALTSGLRHGFAPAFGVGLGAALVDGLYALLAAVGLAAVIGSPPPGELQLVGGGALLCIGGLMVRARGADAAALATFRRGLGVSFGATLANPTTVVSWAAAFTAVVPGLELSEVETVAVLPAFVALGTLAWFSLLAGTATLARRRIGPRALRVASMAAGLIVMGFGAFFLVSGLFA